MNERANRSSLDVRAAWIVFWRVRPQISAKDDMGRYHRVRWWQGWGTTVRAWWLMGHGKHLVS